MPCPEVTTPGEGTDANSDRALEMALAVARARAAMLCKAAGETCAEVVHTPKHIELLEFKGHHDANNNPVFTIKVRATFYCGSRPGCLFFWWPILAGTGPVSTADQLGEPVPIETDSTTPDGRV